jgi:hypothetical protein
MASKAGSAGHSIKDIRCVIEDSPGFVMDADWTNARASATQSIHQLILDALHIGNVDVKSCKILHPLHLMVR